MNQRIITYLTFAVMALLTLSGCSDNDGRFTIKGTVAGQRTMNLRMVYNGNDVTNNVLLAAREGKFEFEGHAPADGALLEILDNEFRPLGRMLVEDGGEYKVAVNPADLYAFRAEGSELNQRWTDWVAQNRATLAKRNAGDINALVAKYVKANPTDKLSTLLLVSEYNAAADPAGAQALAKAIAKEARPDALIQSWLSANSRIDGTAAAVKVLPIKYFDRQDTISTFRPADARVNLLVFSNQYSGRKDSIVKELRRLDKKRAAGRFAMLDVNLDGDTITWRREARNDTVTWPTAWAAGSVAAPGVDRLQVVDLPFFIVADNAGKQIYRGRSLKKAVATVDSLTKNN